MGKENKIAPPQTLEEALTLISGLNEKNANQEATIMEQNELIDGLSKKLEKLESKVASGVLTPTITIKKKTYKVMAAVKHKGEILKPAKLAENEELCIELLKIDGQTILIEEDDN